MFDPGLFSDVETLVASKFCIDFWNDLTDEYRRQYTFWVGQVYQGSVYYSSSKWDECEELQLAVIEYYDERQAEMEYPSNKGM